jgi:hypothetical protein
MAIDPTPSSDTESTPDDPSRVNPAPSFDTATTPDDPSRAQAEMDELRAENRALQRRMDTMLELLAKLPVKKEDDKADVKATTIDDLMGYDDFRPTKEARTTAEVAIAGGSPFSGKERNELSATEKQKFQERAMKGLTRKYKSIIDMNGLESMLTLDNIVAFEDLHEELTKHLTRLGMMNVFYLIDFDSEDNPYPFDVVMNTNIIESFHSISIERLLKTIDFLVHCGSNYHLENLQWSYDYIMNSCTVELQDILRSKIKKYEQHLHTGPLLFWLLMNQLTCSNAAAVRVVTNHVTTLTMEKFEGESIPMATKTLRAGFRWLKTVRKMPADPETITLNLMKTCTVPAFLRFIEALATNARLNKIALDADYVMTHAEDTYRSLVLLKEWDISGTNSSSFNAIGRGTGNNNNRGRNNTSGVSNPLYLPPTEGGSEVRDINGKEHKYCKRCRRWRNDSGKHTTSEHVRRSDLPSPAGTNSASPPSTPSPAVPVSLDSNASVTPLTASTPTAQPTRLTRNPAYSSTTRVSFVGGL